MKKMKLAALFVAAASMVGFTSCLDGDTDTTRYGNEIMKVSGAFGYYNFQSNGGYSVVPVNSSDLAELTLSNPFAWVYYSYDSSTVTENAPSLDAQIISVTEIKTSAVSVAAATDDDGNAPIYDVPNLVGGDHPLCYDQNSLFLPLAYYYAASDDKDKLEAELNAHTFTLYYNEEKSTEAVMFLQLRHDVTDTSVNRTTRGGEYRYFPIASLLSTYRTTYSSLPPKITVEYVQSNSSEMTSTSTKSISFDFGEYFEETAD